MTIYLVIDRKYNPQFRGTEDECMEYIRKTVSGGTWVALTQKGYELVAANQ